MYLFKLKNNNKGSSSIMWATLIMATIIMLCFLLDLTNLFVAKNIIIERSTWLASVGTKQGGFNGSTPYGWTDFYSTPYITSSGAKAYLRSSLEGYAFIDEVSLDGAEMVPYKSEGTITCSATYNPYFLMNMFGPYEIEHSSKFVGFWVYRTTNI